MKTLSKLSVLTVILFFCSSMLSAQSYTIQGSQTRGTPGKNAKLECNPVQIAKAVRITAVSGDNAGFWISDGKTTVASFWQPNDVSAVGTVLQPGTYYVYPDLRKNQNHASIAIKLE
jgi:hypothetical protein